MEKKKYNYKDMMLESANGYMMPFALGDEEELQETLGYGQQTHPQTGQQFFHHGIDYAVKGKDLYALADGLVIGAGNDSIHENYIITKYGKYEVTYGHVAEAYTPYGTPVKPGQVIAKAGNFLHIGVRFDGQDLDPQELLAVVWANIQQLAAMGIQQDPKDKLFDGKEVKTKYDADANEIMLMMLRFLPVYLNEIRTGEYVPSQNTENDLRDIYTSASAKNYYYETIPTLSNPLGMTSRALPLIEKVQNLLIGDFLNYMALRHGRYVSTWSEDQKKNFLMTQQ
ncbi:MAG: M23 family metallopeptidase [Prevotella sp.]|nr:M23 family metallopeptidase [Prevotella sp.]